MILVTFKTWVNGLSFCLLLEFGGHFEYYVILITFRTYFVGNDKVNYKIIKYDCPFNFVYFSMEYLCILLEFMVYFVHCFCLHNSGNPAIHYSIFGVQRYTLLFAINNIAITSHSRNLRWLKLVTNNLFIHILIFHKNWSILFFIYFLNNL
jgi:hypothetical protein